jgi:hypothetical protein
VLGVGQLIELSSLPAAVSLTAGRTIGLRSPRLSVSISGWATMALLAFPPAVHEVVDVQSMDCKNPPPGVDVGGGSKVARQVDSRSV